MKLLLENWREYMNEGRWSRPPERKNAVRILDNIPRWSIVQMGDNLFWFSGTSFTPLDHLDIGTSGGTAERSARDWSGGVVHMKRAAMLDELEEDPNWIKMVLDPIQAEQISDQFKPLRDQIEKDYLDRGWDGRMFTDEYKRNHPVHIDLNSLKVTLK